jgi:hypothetical protein
MRFPSKQQDVVLVWTSVSSVGSARGKHRELSHKIKSGHRAGQRRLERLVRPRVSILWPLSLVLCNSFLPAAMALNGDASLALRSTLQQRNADAKNRLNPTGGTTDGFDFAKSILLGMRRRWTGYVPNLCLFAAAGASDPIVVY